ncbi:acyl-CoA dehydratase activase [Parafannyhessea umbonata]|uniref:CoA-substrate-specific enzyme activase, putative n=1 Tax=Parafannyhessea umbonata TaxID=604330 RepID=A0A1G6M4B1_9ACTN|nr:acyl-CoA dehydratase activase [Parafannyhessea umbonata]SDC50197.1 CoA-substrate-specific enzyme activase, putative [Parafannyhessea umbonata]
MTENVVCYGCKYAPIELLAGFGADARLIMAEPESFEVAERLAHGNLCGFGKSVLACGLDPNVHQMVLTTCCDVMRRAYDVLKAQGCLDFLWMVDLPHRTGAAERRLLQAQLRSLARAYARFSGRSFEVGRALAAIQVPPAPKPGSVALVGAHAPQSLLDELDRGIDAPVVNHTCTGERILAQPPIELAHAESAGCGRCTTADIAGEGTNASTFDRFVEWYAGALLDQTPCMRMDEVGGRSGLVSGAHHGIVYHTMKFCDYYGFEYADVAGTTATPILKLETDGTRQSAGQLRTRIEAFDETLRTDAAAAAGHDGQSFSPAPNPAGEKDAPHAPAPTTRKEAPMGSTPSDPRYVLGVDSGSTSTDAVVMELDGTIVASVIGATGAKASRGAAAVIQEVLDQAHLTRDDLAMSVATGYGRDAIPNMDVAITEITCHAAGAHYLAPQARTVIDIGGQDSKVIHLNADGTVQNFVMNDKCAAGTGRFLEAMARTLQMPIEELSRQGLEWHHDVTISSMCTVFAESEVVSLIADDTPTPDIIHGLDVSVARKTAALARRVGGEPPYLMTGGVANNEGVVKALSEVLGAPVATHEDSQLCGAIGAAVLGIRRLSR